MKTIIISIITMLAVFQISCAQTQEINGVSDIDEETYTGQNIQNKIIDAFTNSIAAQNNYKLNLLIDKIALMYDRNQNSLFIYWKGYALYYNSVFYLKNGDKKMAKRELDKSIELIENIETKNSEDYALLSMLYSFSCQFIGFPKVIKASEKAAECIEKAKKLDSNNLRAYYVEAHNNYYTPQEYGGGKMVEESLLKALSLPVQKINNPYLPSWGRQESFEMLTNYYIKTNNIEQAKKYIELGLSEYPDSYVLSNNKSKLSL